MKFIYNDDNDYYYNYYCCYYFDIDLQFVFMIFVYSDPYEDQFAKRRESKKQRIAKNEARRRRNVDEAEKVTSQQSSNINDIRTARKEELQQKIRTSKTATASNGKFDKPLEGEPKTKGVKRKVRKPRH